MILLTVVGLLIYGLPLYGCFESKVTIDFGQTVKFSSDLDNSPIMVIRGLNTSECPECC